MSASHMVTGAVWMIFLLMHCFVGLSFRKRVHHPVCYRRMRRSGVWQTKLLGEFSVNIVYSGMPLREKPIADPSLIPIETPPFQSLEFFSDVESPATQANLKFDFIDHLNIPYLSRDSAIEGFQGLVPFLEREDKGAYIIFSELEPSSHRGESPETNLYYTYVDQDIFSSGSGATPGMDWSSDCLLLRIS